MSHHPPRIPPTLDERTRQRCEAELRDLGIRDATVRQDHRSVVIEGAAPDWERFVAAGYAAAHWGFKGVVNDIATDGVTPEVLPGPDFRDRALEGAAFDVAIIGGGVVGCAIARELSRLDLSVCLLEKEYDVAVHTSSRNDGMIHDGFAATPGSRKAHYNVRGNRLYDTWCRELGIEFRRHGSLVLFRSPLSRLLYPFLADRARRNGVDGWEYWSRGRVKAEEPLVTNDQHGAFFLPSAGVLSPYKLTVAMAENAIANGVRFSLNTVVEGMTVENRRVTAIRTNRGTLRAKAVVNAAGNWADVVAGMAGDRFFSLHQRRGTDLVLDRQAGRFQRHIMGMPPLAQASSKTKGGGVITTPEGNILIGPTACEAPGRENYATSRAELDELGKHVRLNTTFSFGQVITYFAGVRPCTWEEDFIVEPSERVDNLVHAAGIQSPGLASAPAIAEDIAAMVKSILEKEIEVKPRPGFNPCRPAPAAPQALSPAERSALIARDPAYGRIVCRCEAVSEGEIRDALRSPLPVPALDAVKRRTRAGTGRCHGGFCTPRVMEIIAREAGLPLAKVTKKGGHSELAMGITKGGEHGND